MLALLALGCAGPTARPEVLLTGWTYAWEQLSHRISRVEVAVADDTSLQLALVGGDWSTGATFEDTPTYRVRFQRFTAPDLDVRRGSATFLVGPDPAGGAELEFDVSDLPEDRELNALLNGFSIVTDTPQDSAYPDYDPAFGYTSNGFGFALGAVEREGDRAVVPIEATVRWGPQDREDMNAAIPLAVTEVRVDVALVASSLPSEVQAIRGESDPPHDTVSYSEQPPMVVPVRFSDGASEGLVGWRSFDLQLNLAGPDAGRGDYLRAFGAELAPLGAGPGSFDGEATATLSTSSLIELSDPHAAFEGELVRVGSRDLVSEHWRVDGSHPTGASSTGPTAP